MTRGLNRSLIAVLFAAVALAPALAAKPAGLSAPSPLLQRFFSPPDPPTVEYRALAPPAAARHPAGRRIDFPQARRRRSGTAGGTAFENALHVDPARRHRPVVSAACGRSHARGAGIGGDAFDRRPVDLSHVLRLRIRER